MPLIIDGILLCVGSYWFVTSVTSLTLFQGMSIGGGLLPAFASGLLILLAPGDRRSLPHWQLADRPVFDTDRDAVLLAEGPV